MEGSGCIKKLRESNGGKMRGEKAEKPKWRDNSSWILELGRSGPTVCNKDIYEVIK